MRCTQAAAAAVDSEAGFNAASGQQATDQGGWLGSWAWGGNLRRQDANATDNSTADAAAGEEAAEEPVGFQCFGQVRLREPRMHMRRALQLQMAHAQVH